MTDADRLREVLPRLHAKGIAGELRSSMNMVRFGGQIVFTINHRIVGDSEAITYAIGAMVEAAYKSGDMHASAYVPSSLLADQLRIAEKMGLIGPPATEEPQ